MRDPVMFRLDGETLRLLKAGLCFCENNVLTRGLWNHPIELRNKLKLLGFGYSATFTRVCFFLAALFYCRS